MNFCFERFVSYAQLTRINKPIGALLLLWPALWALWLAAGGLPDLKVLLVFVLGVFLMRSAGCAINDYADRKIDPLVERTKNRPLASGKIKPKEALVVFFVLILTSFVLVLTLNMLTIALSFVGAFLAASYPFLKRFTHLPQFYLGAAFGWAVPMAYAAQLGSIPLVGWLVFVLTLIWAVIYDTMYAMVDRDDDLKIGVKSTAILFGDNDRLIIGLLQLLMLAGLLLVGWLENRGVIYCIGVAVAALLFAYQQCLIKNRERPNCFTAFLNNNWFGFVIFLGLALDYAVEV